ncbi:thioredoxin reductase [Angulomicrobium tetraedrale]|uniref:Thioredoxin reductase n=1 Tax=Ancylobacter tetraedralis TaxID=217068 RepID=A0A839ZFS9_9HYPH|nr:FAD-dependent oxidoreductase [Ancylobacter tetraedralis]MBB3773432.1 thioredoxin reductase [Ancylobacter tetraedralis]
MSEASKKVMVIGAGPAGCAAALAAAGYGLDVTLVDEHPQAVSAMSLDAPYFYGSRLAPVLSNDGEIADRVLGANEGLMECLDAGVEVLVGTSAWGVFRSGPNSRHLAGDQVGVADRERSWMLPFDYLVIASGARDLVLSFPGWELPGVLGVMGASMLLRSYEALGGRSLLILGSGNAALAFARDALSAGLTIAGIAEPAPQVQGDAALARELEEAGARFYLGHTIQRALGEGSVSGARLAGHDGSDRPGQTIDVPCDTICLAFGMVPNVELPAVAGCAIGFDPARSGWAPMVDANMETTLPGIFVVGDAAGVSEAGCLDSAGAVAQAHRAAASIAMREGLRAAPADAPPRPTASAATHFPPDLWLSSLTASGGMDVLVCQCEEVSRRDLVTVAPPAYLRASEKIAPDAVTMLTVNGHPSQDSLKRLTRAGMGHCQGKRCREHSAMLLARAAGVDLADVVTGSYRIPVRPIPLGVIAPADESAQMRADWPVWLHPVAEETGH